MDRLPAWTPLAIFIVVVGVMTFALPAPEPADPKIEVVHGFANAAWARYMCPEKWWLSTDDGVTSCYLPRSVWEGRQDYLVGLMLEYLPGVEDAAGHTVISGLHLEYDDVGLERITLWAVRGMDL